VATQNKHPKQIAREMAARAAAAKMPEFKVGVFGRYGAGKTSLARRFANDAFSLETTSTVGVDFFNTSLRLADRREVMLCIWDTAGQERYDAMNKRLLRGLHGVLVVFALDDAESLVDAARWAECVRLDDAVPLVLVGAKLDLVAAPEHEAALLKVRAAARELAQKYASVYVETSARDGAGVAAAFLELAEKMVAWREQLAYVAGVMAGGAAPERPSGGVFAAKGGGGGEFPDDVVALDRALREPRARRCCW
jgi:small GTP-binding protein